eukprot:179158_1
MASVCWWFVLSIVQNAVQNKAETRYCGGSKSCICTNNDLCTLQCNGKDQCKGSDMILGCMPGYPCNVICNSQGEENACEDATIDATGATTLTVACHDKQACMSARIKCGTGDCNVICISTDSTGSNCDSLTLQCGSGNCAIQCDLGPNMCSNVKVLGTGLSQSFQCIDNTNECRYIDQIVYPFTRATDPPTPNTPNPTLRPSMHPSVRPTSNPTYSTSPPTVRPSRFPTTKPSVFPTLSPTFNPTHKPTPKPLTRQPTFYTRAPTVRPTPSGPTVRPSRPPTRRPSPSPTTSNPTQSPIIPGTPTRSPIPTPRPSTPRPTSASVQDTPIRTPTVSPPTQPKYFVVGYVTNSPTKSRARSVTTHEDPMYTDKVVSLVMNNKLYASIGAGVVACCLLLICIRCCGCGKSVAKQAKYKQPSQANKHIFPNPKPPLICVKSISGVSGRAQRMALNKSHEFIPPPPRGPPPGHHGIEGMDAVDIALPGTMGIIGPAGGYMGHNGNRPRHTRGNACVENGVNKVDVIEVKEDMDDTDTDETEDLGDLNGDRVGVGSNKNARFTAGSFRDFSISHMDDDDHVQDVEFLDDMPIRQ